MLLHSGHFPPAKSRKDAEVISICERSRVPVMQSGVNEALMEAPIVYRGDNLISGGTFYPLALCLHDGFLS